MKRKKIKFPVTLYLYNGRAKQPEIWFADSEAEIVHWKQQYERIRVERNGVELKINFKKLIKRVERTAPKRETRRRELDDEIPELLREDAWPDIPIEPVVDALPPGVQKSDLFYDGWKGTKKGTFF